MPACGRAFSPVLATMMVVCLSAPLSAQYNQQRGAVVGGLTGAAAGAIIGENSDEPGVGAAIGGIVGALAGKVLGNVQDQHISIRRLGSNRWFISKVVRCPCKTWWRWHKVALGIRLSPAKFRIVDCSDRSKSPTSSS
jgi:uncharacterized protein YcfJ